MTRQRKNRWRRFTCAMVLAGLTAAGRAESRTGTDRGPVQLSVVPQVQLLDRETSVTLLRLNLLWGRNRDVRWLDAGLVNHVDGSFTGLALGVGNLTGEEVRGVTVGLWNAAGWNLEGVQAGLLNAVGHDSVGGQYGVMNHAENVRGLQCGLLNHAWTVQGLQLGLLNVTGQLDGLQVGLLNLVTERYAYPALPLINASW